MYSLFRKKHTTPSLLKVQNNGKSHYDVKKTIYHRSDCNLGIAVLSEKPSSGNPVRRRDYNFIIGSRFQDNKNRSDRLLDSHSQGRSGKLGSSIDRNEGNGDADLILKYNTNDKYSRMCRIVIEQESSAKTDTIFVKQYGKAEIISLGRESISFPVVDDERNIAINGNFSNAQLSKIKIDVKYEGSSTDWINAGIDIPTASLKVTNTTNDQVGERKAEVILTYKDGWETEHSLSLPVTQMGNRAANATQVTFAELKSRIAEAAGTLTIADDITIEGVVINDNDNPNSAMNPNLSQTTIDYSVNYRTSYLQTEDASEGVSIVFNTTEDNVLKSLMKARISSRMRYWKSSTILRDM